MSNVWSNADNWSAGTEPGTATFPTKGSIVNPNLTQSETITGIVFQDGGWTITQSGANTFSIQGTGIDFSAGSGSVTVNPIVRNTATNTWSISAGNTVTVASRLEFNGQTMTKDGGGTLVLNGNAANTQSSLRTLNVSGGTVLLNGTNFSSSAGTGTLTVAASGTLGGSGSVGVGSNGTDVVNGSISGTVAPGNATSGVSNPGRLTMAGATTFNNNSTLALQLNSDTVATGYDQYRTGGVSLGTMVNLTLSLGYDPLVDTVFTLVDNTAGSAIGGGGRFQFGTTTLNEGTVVSVTNGTSGNSFDFQASYVGGTGNDFTLTVVPEPSAVLMLLGGGGVLGLLRRRRG